MLSARARAVAILTACLAATPSCGEPAPIAAPPAPTSKPTASASAPIASSAVAPSYALLRDVAGLGAGARHACARLTNGAVVCWGANDRGQLGDVAAAGSAIAAPVPGIDHAAQLAVSPGDFACVRHDDGAVSCWGHGARKAARIAGIAGAIQIAAGDGAGACAVLGDATVRCWTMDNIGKPAVDPAPGLRDVVQIATASDHTCALRKSGGVSCWGEGCAGQLGDGTRAARPAPVAVVDLPRALAVAVSPARSCALLPSQALACWGAAGWSCDASIAERCIPDSGKPACGYLTGPRPRVARGVTHVAALPEGRLGCVVLENGGVACWDGRTEAPSFPGVVGPVEGITGATAVSAGERHACALVVDGTVRCWGEDEAGQLGGGAVGQPSASPIAVMTR
jgi:alpha-tubulin suppressor-like RCC1 family protein